jgi:hypothetical protein
MTFDNGYKIQVQKLEGPGLMGEGLELWADPTHPRQRLSHSERGQSAFKTCALGHWQALVP